MSEVLLDHPIDRALLDRYQRDFPMVERPFAVIGQALDLSEQEVIQHVDRLQQSGAISRIGAVVAPHRAGWSTLAAMAVPEERLEDVAALVSSLPEVNHNYQREHTFNLWFVVTGEHQAHVAAVLATLHDRTGLDILDLPLEEAFHIDLGFPLRWA